jgi:hypothetical protein
MISVVDKVGSLQRVLRKIHHQVARILLKNSCGAFIITVTWDLLAVYKSSNPWYSGVFKWLPLLRHKNLWWRSTCVMYLITLSHVRSLVLEVRYKDHAFVSLAPRKQAGGRWVFKKWLVFILWGISCCFKILARPLNTGGPWKCSEPSFHGEVLTTQMPVYVGIGVMTTLWSMVFSPPR